MTATDRHHYARRATMATLLVAGIAILVAGIWLAFTARAIRNTHLESVASSAETFGQWKGLGDQLEGLLRSERLRLLFQHGLETGSAPSAPSAQ